MGASPASLTFLHATKRECLHNTSLAFFLDVNLSPVVVSLLPSSKTHPRPLGQLNFGIASPKHEPKPGVSFCAANNVPYRNLRPAAHKRFEACRPRSGRSRRHAILKKQPDYVQLLTYYRRPESELTDFEAIRALRFLSTASLQVMTPRVVQKDTPGKLDSLLVP